MGKPSKPTMGFLPTNHSYYYSRRPRSSGHGGAGGGGGEKFVGELVGRFLLVYRVDDCREIDSTRRRVDLHNRISRIGVKYATKYSSTGGIGGGGDGDGGGGDDSGRRNERDRDR
ncbi:hypothetical protein M0804_003833 [Polistes exclamans]|nr:hypothetical protein M0804_003833 [Polistes exclamans]